MRMRVPPQALVFGRADRYNRAMRTSLAFLGCVLAAGCWSTSNSASTISNSTAKDPHATRSGLFTITQASFGPIGTKSPATLDGLRKLFVGYDVKAVNDGSLEFDVFQGNERLLFVVPNEDGTVFNVHATSNKIALADRGWRVGETFQGASAIDTCECWGENPTCFKKGEHIAVNFKRACTGLTEGDARALKVLDGIAVERVIWSPSAFGGDAGFGGHTYGGAGGGNPCSGGGGANPCGGD